MRYLAFFAMAILLTNHGVAADVSCLPTEDSPKDLSHFLDENCVLEPSYPLDLSTYTVNKDSCEGVQASPMGISKITAEFTALGSGLSDDCYKIVIDPGGNLIAAGNFNQAGGNPANNIAMWDGTNWSTLGAGVNGIILDMVQDNAGNIYVGGLFTAAGGNPANRVAMWDGTNWSALGTGLDDAATDIMLDNAGNLYVAGRFNMAGGIVANHIAIWDGAAWSTLGTGFNNDTEALAEDNLGNIYIGGAFTMADGIAINRLAVWDGTTFAAVGGGLNNRCYELFIDPTGIMYASGTFTMAGGIAANRIASWDGTAWSPLGTGLNDLAWAMDMDANGDLYVGGFFTTAGGNAARRIAIWDGLVWTELGGGVGNSVAAVTIAPNGNVYVGGDFVQFTPAGFIFKITVWCNTVLSLDLSFFEAEYMDNKTMLSWGESYEGLQKGFQVEHSLDGLSWEPLAQVPYKEIVYEERGYTYAHTNPPKGLNYYRLKQIDQDGGFMYTEVLEVQVNSPIEVYPNPSRDKISLNGISEGNTNIQLHDATGKWVQTLVLSGSEIDISHLSAGIYFLSIQGETKIHKVKFIKE